MNQPPIRISNIEMVPTLDLYKLRHPKNPNKHPKDQLERLASIIEFQGWRYPIKVSTRSGLITSGHGRLEAAELRGWVEVPVSYQDYDSDEQEIADLVADNAIASWSELDFKTINEFVPELGPDFDLDLLGIKNFTLDVSDKVSPDADAIPENPETRCQPGDRWTLGDHALVCGDSTDINLVEQLMRGQKCHLLFTDPPYSQSVTASGFLKNRPSFKNLSESDLNSFDPDPFLSIVSILSPENFYVHCNKELICKYISSMVDSGRLWDLLAICKRNPIPTKSNKFLSDIEWIVFSRKSGAYFNDKLEYDWYRKAQLVSTKASAYGHPTEKWVELIEQYVQISSEVGDSVVDLYGGSGSTLIACERLKRRCFTMEIAPHYCDMILARWESYAGKQATLESRMEQVD